MLEKQVKPRAFFTPMAHDVFISHSTKDKPISDAICAALEDGGIRCWIAPRDVQPGRSFAGEINRAIQHSKAMVLVFSAHSNNSEQVLREVQLAVNAHLHILQFRIEEVRLNDDLEYFLSTPHWLDAMDPPLENHLQRLKTSVSALLGAPAREAVATSAPVSPPTARLEIPAPRSRPPVNGPRKLFFAAIAVLLAAGIIAGWWFGVEQPRREAERRRAVVEQESLAGEKRAKAEAEAENERVAGVQRAQEEEAKRKEEARNAIAAATKAKPYVNSLGMKFVPVPIAGGPSSGQPVFFSVWETRVKDFAKFIEESGYEMSKGEDAYTIESDGIGGYTWKQAGGSWRHPHFPAEALQTEEHPVVCVSWSDAVAFSVWLTEREHKAGRLAAEWSYRLPSDHEWSCAVAICGEENASATPEEKDGKIKNIYPWGKTWPPPRGAGNYCGEESRLGVTSTKNWSVIEGYRDGAPRTSAAGQYEANEYGVYDLGGNVWEWCADEYKAGEGWRVLRGASWYDYNPGYLLSSSRSRAPAARNVYSGFRVVVAGSSSAR